MAETEGQWKIFTLDEANALLPRLSSLMERLQKRFLALKTAVGAEGQVSLEEKVREKQDDPLVRKMLLEIQEWISEIEGLGCHFKGIDLGLVDFPAIIDGQVAYYCWQHGEGEIAFWHSLEEGFSGRLPLNTGSAHRHLN